MGALVGLDFGSRVGWLASCEMPMHCSLMWVDYFTSILCYTRVRVRSIDPLIIYFIEMSPPNVDVPTTSEGVLVVGKCVSSIYKMSLILI